jgi:transposase
MLSLPSSVRIFLARMPVDFRKAHDGLHAIVREEFGDDPLSGHVFVFLNRRVDRVKLLVWDRNGFWLLYKRLERGTFRRPGGGEGARVEVSRAELMMLLEGIDLKHGKMRRHFADGVYVEERGRRDAADDRRAAG